MQKATLMQKLSPSTKKTLVSGAALIALYLLFVIVKGETFLGQMNQINILHQVVCYAVIGYGITFVLVGGCGDLSAGSTMGLAGMIVMWCIMAGLPTWLAFVITLIAGAVMGTSTCTTFVESAAGVGAGGRTGLTSVVVAACFAICLFLSPLASLVPSCATAPALIWVGVLMLKNFAKVDMQDVRSAVPAFLALIMMPLTYSISNGIGIGCIAYTLITLCTGKYTKKDIAVTVIAVLFVLRFCLITM